MTILNDIVENTRAKLQAKKAELPLEDIISKLNGLNLPKGAFKESLLNKDKLLLLRLKRLHQVQGLFQKISTL